MLIRPDPLLPGAGVGIFLPASPAKEPYRSRGLQALRQMGLRPREVGDVFSGRGFFSRPPQQTLDDLQRFFDDRDVQALWAGRGGYGSNLLLPLLERMRIPFPKIVIGSSDVSYFLWYLLEKRRMVVFYGPMVYAGMADGACDQEQILAAISPNQQPMRFAGKVLCPGKASGLLTGGCLSNFISLLGTRYLPQLKKRILLLEDVNERPYRLDRMLWHCEQAGVFQGLRGLLLGEFPNCFRNDEEKEFFYGRWSQRLAHLRIPVLFDMPFGHARCAQLLPLGVRAEIDTESGSLPLGCDIGVKW
jgi:muramoyltetrapeptide carboxypeptidase